MPCGDRCHRHGFIFAAVRRRVHIADLQGRSRRPARHRPRPESLLFSSARKQGKIIGEGDPTGCVAQARKLHRERPGRQRRRRPGRRPSTRDPRSRVASADPPTGKQWALRTTFAEPGHPNAQLLLPAIVPALVGMAGPFSSDTLNESARDFPLRGRSQSRGQTSPDCDQRRNSPGTSGQGLPGSVNTARGR